MIIFRVDASHDIGTGHLMRCLCLADAFVKQGYSCRFLSRYIPEYLEDKVKNKGHELLILPLIQKDQLDDLQYSRWLGVSQSSDAKATLNAISDINVDWLVIDHYGIDHRWEKQLRQVSPKIMVIDDLANRKHDCDVLLDQNFHDKNSERYASLVPEHCRLMLGPKFSILRDEFWHQRTKLRIRNGDVKRVLIYFGGFDNSNFTLLALQSIIKLNNKKIIVDVVVGKEHSHLKEITDFCQKADYKLHLQVDNIAELMALADLSIGAGGISTWERCCLGLPTIAFCTAENQKSQLIYAALNGLLYNPNFLHDKISELLIHIASCINNPLLLKFISTKAMEAVDGKGVSRIIRKLELTSLSLRLATAEDSEQIYQWRNLPHVRNFSKDPKIITKEIHQKWYLTTLEDSKIKLLIGESNSIPVGVIRFDIGDNNTLISIYLISLEYSPVSGAQLLNAAEKWLFENQPNISFIYADILDENIASKKMFESAGYKIKSQSYEKKLINYV